MMNKIVKSQKFVTFVWVLGLVIVWELGAFVIAGTQKLNVNGDNEKTNSGIPQFILTARGAAVYNIRNYFFWIYSKI